MKSTIQILLCLSILLARGLCEVSEYPNFYFWKDTYTPIKSPSVVGTWQNLKKVLKSDADVTYEFKNDGTVVINVVAAGNDAPTTTISKWKQRHNGMVYLLRAVSPEKKERFVYVGFIEKGVFVADQLCYQDEYSKVRSLGQ